METRTCKYKACLIGNDYAKDGGKELFAKMQCVLITNP